MDFSQTSFILSTPLLETAPTDTGSEIAFAGRSNAGKSSFLNALCRQKSLAVTSKTPGRTRHLVFFQCQESAQQRLVDLPGYGFAKASKTEQKKWQNLIGTYISGRQSLRGIVLICDVRHPLRDTDFMLLDLVESLQIPVHLFFSKADKISNNVLFQQKKQFEKQLEAFQVVSFSVGSSKSKKGLEAVENWIRLYLR